MKILRISDCRHCPFGWSDYFRGHFMQAKCNHYKFHSKYDWERNYKEMQEDDYDSYPSWCPLDEQDSLKKGDNIMTFVFKCDRCGNEIPCILIINDDTGDAPKCCPWSGSDKECDWNLMKVMTD